jgi:VWFA-related protein
MSRLNAIICIGFIWLGLNQKDEETNDFKIQVGVEEVRVDAVVVDRSGRQITGLTAGDFEVYQDGQQQKIISSTYIRHEQTRPDKNIILSTNPGTARDTSISAPRNELRRTIVFLVDDLSMDMTEVYYAHMSLQKFVENQMQPHDLVAIMQTSGGNAGLQPFSSDKKQLLARISKIKWNPLLEHPTALPQAMAIDYNIKALQDMPGRKVLFLLSAQVMLPDQLSRDPMYERLADEAMRAGVVIHTMDMMGLVTDPAIGVEAERQSVKLAARNMNKPLPLSQKTGGIFVTNNNFFVSGIGYAEEEMKGYYLLSFIPPAGTFDPAGPSAYHKVKVTVRRPGTEVHTRDGFYGLLKAAKEPGRSRNSLIEAMSSPFQYNDLTLLLASGYIHDPQKGYLVRAWLHLDGNRLGIIKEKDGGLTISVEAVATATDIDGLTCDSGNTRISFPVNDSDIEWIKENGLKISITIPAVKPGSYYVRAAVKDLATGAIGSAYQFLDIPDLKKNALSLSSLFILNRPEDASSLQSGIPEESLNPARPLALRSQALRRYRSGESFDYMAILYNAKSQDGTNLEWQFILFQNGSEIFRSKPEALTVKGSENAEGIPIKSTLKIESTMQPGDYVLQLIVRDKREKKRIATQSMNLEIGAGDVGAPALQETQGVMRKTVVEMTAEELQRFYRKELSHVKFDSSQEKLKYILDKAGERVVSFFRDFSNSSAKERVELSKSYRDAESGVSVPILEHTRSSGITNRVEGYHYLILPGSGRDENSWIEDRTDKDNRIVRGIPGFIMSSGHAGKCLYLHPRHQANSNFRYIGRETEKAGAYVIAFSQKPEAADYLSRYSESNSTTAVRFLVQGLIWLDPDSCQIIRMRTSMLSPEMQTTLRETITDIRYGKNLFDNSPREFWLPQEINVSWEVSQSNGLIVIYRNRHKYSDFHFFAVDTDYKISQPKSEN